MRDARVDRVGVVVPARDEAASIGRCLAALDAAARVVEDHGVTIEVVVVVNATSDRTADLARAAGATVVELAGAGVGSARAAGADRVLRGHDGHLTWLATTDADSAVPPRWLAHQLRLAGAGADAVVGTVRLADADLLAHPTWWGRYQVGLRQVPHGHVHGAHLSVRGSLYRQVGGFAPLLAHEDADLVARLDAVSTRVVRTAAEPVVTSARTAGRTPAGVARDLRSVAAAQA